MNILQNISSYLGQKLLSSNGPTYTVLSKTQTYQIRKYNKCIVAETIIESDHQSAGNLAFGILAGYIFGKNQKKVKIQMTAPVAEVEVARGQYAVQFFTPPEWTLDSLPKPLDSRVVLKEIPERVMIVIRYNGGWSEQLYAEHLKQLQSQCKKNNIRIKQNAEPIWARYNSPMAPSPIRTNQIMYEVQFQGKK